MITMSPSIKELAVALIAAQKEIKLVAKSAENPFYKSKYADLPAIDAEYKRVFPKHGLVVTQFPDNKGLTTMLMHESGEWMASTAEIPLAKNDPQGLGSAITYMRRYGLGAVCGIVSDSDDDDGNMATHHAPAKSERPQIEGMGGERIMNGIVAMTKSSAHTEEPEMARVIGKIESHEDGTNGWVSYTIKGKKLSTKKPETILIMDKAKDKDCEVQVDYTTIVKGRFTNYYISKATEVEALPF